MSNEKCVLEPCLSSRVKWQRVAVVVVFPPFPQNIKTVQIMGITGPHMDEIAIFPSKLEHIHLKF